MCVFQLAFDVVRMLKEFMHSAKPYQNWILVMPHRVAMDLFASSDQLKLQPPNVLSDDQLKGFREIGE